MLQDSGKDRILPVNGVRLSAIYAGIYNKTRPDLAIISLDNNCVVSAVFTKNSFCAAPVTVCKQHLHKSRPLLLLINAGNANAGIGEQGYDDAMQCCNEIAKLCSIPVESVLPFSTGVIGKPLPVEKICNAMPSLVSNLSLNNWEQASKAILTTDTVTKTISRQVELDGNTVTITGMAKGSGMIKPDLATMLAFIATDVAIDKPVLHEILKYSVEKSFNRISIDGDTSTNDACVLIATGKAGNTVIESIKGSDFKIISDAVCDVCIYLAQAIVRDGEGATKFVTLDIHGGSDQDECLKVAESIAHSPLVKTALFASDPNWGRILAAIGRAGIANLDINRVGIYVNDLCIVENGCVAGEYTEEAGQSVFSTKNINIRVLLQRGSENMQFWTCDLSYDYVRINAEYRT